MDKIEHGKNPYKVPLFSNAVLDAAADAMIEYVRRRGVLDFPKPPLTGRERAEFRSAMRIATLFLIHGLTAALSRRADKLDSVSPRRAEAIRDAMVELELISMEDAENVRE